MIRWLTASAVLACGTPAFSQDFNTIDFEEFPEGEPPALGHLGIMLFIPDSKGDQPIVCRVGAPLMGFNSEAGGDDAPMTRGEAALTDPIVDGDPRFGVDIGISFMEFVETVQLFVIDIDGAETFTLRAYSKGKEVASDTHSAGDPGTGDGVSTAFRVDAPFIDTVILDCEQRSGVGYAIDLLSYRRPCLESCGPVICVSQESAPGAADWDQNFLGTIAVHATFASPTDLYTYNIVHPNSFGGSIINPQAGTSHLLLTNSFDVGDFPVNLVMVHDRPGGPGPGHAEVRVEILGHPSARWQVLDDPPELEGESAYTGVVGESVFTSNQSWGECCTDGGVIYYISGTWQIFVSFEDVDGDTSRPAVEGLDEWAIISADGNRIFPSMEEGRRVRIRPLRDCIADFNRDCSVNIFDYLEFQSAFGRGESRCDFDGNGRLNIFDYLGFQTEFANGCP